MFVKSKKLTLPTSNTYHLHEFLKIFLSLEKIEYWVKDWVDVFNTQRIQHPKVDGKKK